MKEEWNLSDSKRDYMAREFFHEYGLAVVMDSTLTNDPFALKSRELVVRKKVVGKYHDKLRAMGCPPEQIDVVWNRVLSRVMVVGPLKDLD